MVILLIFCERCDEFYARACWSARAASTEFRILARSQSGFNPGFDSALPPSSRGGRGERANFEQADNGERRTTQALQLDTAEQFQALEPL
jgi:hypothetical protein